jgi:hypothetical protein
MHQSSFEAQNVALILNAYVKADRLRPALFSHLAKVIDALDFGDSDSQNVAVIMNALVKVGCSFV